MIWIVLSIVATMVVVGLVMAHRGQETVKTLAESRGWRYAKTGPETFRLTGREASGEWSLTYGRGAGTDGSKTLAFEFAVDAPGEATLVPRLLYRLISNPLARGLNALPGKKAGLVMDAPERPADWVRQPIFSREYALVGDPEALRPVLHDDAVSRLLGYGMPLVPTVMARYGRCRITLNVRTTPQALEALPGLVELGRSMMRQGAPRAAAVPASLG